MDAAIILRNGPTILVSICLIAYATYNFVRGGVYVRGKGWQAKNDAIKSYYFTQGILILIAFGQIASVVVWSFR